MWRRQKDLHIDRTLSDPDRNEKCVEEMIASIERKQWLWNEHTTPQNIALRHNNGTKLPNHGIRGLTGQLWPRFEGALRKDRILQERSGHTPTLKVVHGPDQAKRCCGEKRS